MKPNQSPFWLAALTDALAGCLDRGCDIIRVEVELGLPNGHEVTFSQHPQTLSTARIARDQIFSADVPEEDGLSYIHCLHRDLNCDALMTLIDNAAALPDPREWPADVVIIGEPDWEEVG
jgi:hypothetical protein